MWHLDKWHLDTWHLDTWHLDTCIHGGRILGYVAPGYAWGGALALSPWILAGNVALGVQPTALSSKP